jgi:hypothetical protein
MIRWWTTIKAYQDRGISEQNTMKIVVLIVGVISLLLGGLWLLQGLGLVRVRPILCFADCEPIQGASSMWAIAGLLFFTAGALAIFFSLRWRTGR